MSSTLFSWSPGSKEMRARRELNTGSGYGLGKESERLNENRHRMELIGSPLLKKRRRRAQGSTSSSYYDYVSFDYRDLAHSMPSTKEVFRLQGAQLSGSRQRRRMPLKGRSGRTEASCMRNASLHSLAKKVDSSTSLLSFEKARSPGRLGLGRLSKSVLRSRTSYPLRGEALVSKESPIAIGSYVWVLCYGISAVSKDGLQSGPDRGLRSYFLVNQAREAHLEHKEDENLDIYRINMINHAQLKNKEALSLLLW
ncbi:unnamed protein product [Dovyalis caffra]|uniref:Uncharacterized protein n=1 Tax=Dovyalis caffra TaxID=77055 RepID=A0AAV1R5G2_9ROSI|nr:unnamed protein product [Dovyalis caffra]